MLDRLLPWATTSSTKSWQGKVNFNSKIAASWEQVNKEQISALNWNKEGVMFHPHGCRAKLNTLTWINHRCLKKCGEENNWLSIILRFPHVQKQPRDLWHLPYFSWVWDWEDQQCGLFVDTQTSWKKNEDVSLWWQEAQRRADTEVVLYDLTKELGEVGCSNL